MTATIRPAVIDDIPDMLRLNRQLGYEVDAGYLKERLEETATIAFLAIYQEAAIGFAAGLVFNSTHCPRRIARLSALIVDKDARGHGAGHMLVDAFEAEARSRGCHFIELSSHLDREEEGTYDFYESIGYITQTDAGTTYFRKALKDDAQG